MACISITVRRFDHLEGHMKGSLAFSDRPHADHSGISSEVIRRSPITYGLKLKKCIPIMKRYISSSLGRRDRRFKLEKHQEKGLKLYGFGMNCGSRPVSTLTLAQGRQGST